MHWPQRVHCDLTGITEARKDSLKDAQMAPSKTLAHNVHWA